MKLVSLQWEAAAATAYQIQVSTDAANWTTIYSTAGGQGGTETLNVTGSGRYLRVYGTARTSGYGYSLWELTVHTGAAQQPPADWTPVWQDEFTGPAGTSPSANDWIMDIGTGAPGGPDHWGTGEVENMSNSPANVSADDDGHLNITALRDSAGNWTSGRIETKRSDFAAPAGGMLKVTASIRQPNPDDPTGYWPAFWALGAANRAGQTWPGVGETDRSRGRRCSMVGASRMSGSVEKQQNAVNVRCHEDHMISHPRCHCMAWYASPARWTSRWVSAMSPHRPRRRPGKGPRTGDMSGIRRH